MKWWWISFFRCEYIYDLDSITCKLRPIWPFSRLFSSCSVVDAVQGASSAQLCKTGCINQSLKKLLAFPTAHSLSSVLFFFLNKPQQCVLGVPIQMPSPLNAFHDNRSQISLHFFSTWCHARCPVQHRLLQTNVPVSLSFSYWRETGTPPHVLVSCVPGRHWRGLSKLDDAECLTFEHCKHERLIFTEQSLTVWFVDVKCLRSECVFQCYTKTHRMAHKVAHFYASNQ